jgi:hypothetical protein
MNVTQFLQRLSYGPLANLSMSNDGDGTIADSRLPAIVSHINDGLLALYSKFNLREAEVVIDQDEGISSYKLDSKYALTTALANPTLPHYIIDSVSRPFTDDLIKVLRVVNAKGEDLPLNDDNASDGVFTPSSHLLQVPSPQHGLPLYLIYQAKHAPLVHTSLNDEIVLPDVMVEALVSFVAYKVYFYMNGQENAAKAAEHLGNHNRVLAMVVDEDLVSTSQSHTGSKFSDRGFR